MSAHPRRTLTAAAVLAAAALLSACGGGQTGAEKKSTGAAKPPLTVGISLSLSGDFSDPGVAAQRGYKLWADVVNARGGVLGRKVQLSILDDGSDPDRAARNYETLITRRHVDLVFGPFSTLLTVPSAHVADRHHYAFPEPAGGGPKVFAQKLGNVFFVQPAPAVNCGDPFVNWVRSLPRSQRPRTAAYAALDDPFATPIVERARRKLEAAGVKTVFKTIYSSEAANLAPLVRKYAKLKPDLVFAGVQSEDAYSQVRAMVRADFNPKFLFFSNAANSPTEFPKKIGAQNTHGVLSCGDWFSHAKTVGNPEFIQSYIARYGGTPQAIDSGSAEAYAVGQLIQLVAERTGKVDNQTIINSLHKGTWPVVVGNLRWNAVGAPTGSVELAQWSGGKLLPVYPPDQAVAKPQAAKPRWGG